MRRPHVRRLAVALWYGGQAMVLLGATGVILVVFKGPLFAGKVVLEWVFP